MDNARALTESERGLLILALGGAAERWSEWAITIAHDGVATQFAKQAREARALAVDLAGCDRVRLFVDVLEEEAEAFSCTACGRPEADCSAAPCAAVVSDREEA